MTVYDPRTGHKKKVVDACITPHRKNCRGCKFSIDSQLRDGGCGLEYKEAWLMKHENNLDTDDLKDAYEVITEALLDIQNKAIANGYPHRIGSGLV